MQNERKPKEEVLYLHHDELSHHPSNMRRVYRREDVQRMAASIKARGVIQPLIGCRVNGTVQVTCGNLRLAGARLLGDEAPSIPVILRPQEEAEQLLDMAAENLVRVDVDPISEALHYRRLLQEPGMNRTRLSRETGVAYPTIRCRLRLLDLEPEIQDLVAAGELPRGADSTEALLSIPDAGARIKTAQVLARKRADVRLIKATCTRVRKKLLHRQSIGEAGRNGRSYTPALEMTTERASVESGEDGGDVRTYEAATEKDGANGDSTSHTNGRAYTPPLEAALEEGLPPADEAAVPWETLRESVNDACARCSLVGDYNIPLEREPGWTQVLKPQPSWGQLRETAEAHCETCSVRDYEDICAQCPMVEFFQRLTWRLNRDGR